jgi:hypothetical protein
MLAREYWSVICDLAACRIVVSSVLTCSKDADDIAFISYSQLPVKTAVKYIY